LVYDAAHVYGLIEGKVWSSPLKEGADIMTVSTHKTFPGPQGGAIFSDGSEVFKQVSRTIFPWFVSNHHLHRLPATAVTAIEMKYFGESYANQITRNSKALAEALAERGFKVIGENLGYTKSHQVAVDVRQFGGGNKIAKLLEDANIIVNKTCCLMISQKNVSDPSGLRIGVQEMTRYGMKESEMEEIAELFKKVIIDKKDINEVKKR